MTKPERRTVPFMHDWRGNRVEAGDTVVYARGVGRCNEMVEATVVEIFEVQQSWSDRPWAQRAKLKPTRNSRFGSSSDPEKTVTLLVTENITLIKSYATDRRPKNFVDDPLTPR